MDDSKISNLFRECDRNLTQWFASQEDIREKKYVYLWAKSSLEAKRDPEKRKALKQKLEEYLSIEKLRPERLQVWFWDESGFSLRVIRRKTWGQKRSRKEVRGDSRKGHVNVMGALRHSDKKSFVEFLDKGNAANFYKVLEIFYQELVNEWMEAGNQAKDFAEKGAKIVIILDSASLHKTEECIKKTEECIKKIEAAMPNLHLEFLPEYSPDYNLIELVWRSAKEYVANRLFKSIEELESL